MRGFQSSVIKLMPTRDTSGLLRSGVVMLFVIGITVAIGVINDGVAGKFADTLDCNGT